MRRDFRLAANGVTVICPEVPVGSSGVVNGRTYTKRTSDEITPLNASTTCTSGITDMSDMFSGLEEFNRDISSWDTSNVTIMTSMFQDAFAFNQSIGAWDTSNVTDMSVAFAGARAFDQNIGAWDTSNETDMRSMFEDASAFNQDLSKWCVSRFSSKPTSFDLGASAWNTVNRQPVWGTCPPR